VISEANENGDVVNSIRRSTRISQQSIRLRDFVTYKVMHPIENFLSYENITKEYKAYLTSIGKEKESNNFEEALSQSVWCNAMREEVNALEKK
jgi:hypothetical protein